MWTRIELKNRAKTAFRKNYWKCVVVSLILMLFTGGIGSSVNSARNDDSESGVSGFLNTIDPNNDYDFGDGYDDMYDDDYDDMYDDDYDDMYDDDYDDFYDDDHDDFYDNDHDGGHSYRHGADTLAARTVALTGIGDLQLFVDSILLAVNSIILLVFVLLAIFIFQPLEVGGCRFYIENAYGETGVDRVLFAFKNGNYGKTVVTLFLRDLFIALWSLLLVIPGIVKAYEYRMVPYLLADDPNISREDAFRISKEMMTGQKMNAFLLDLSFIGWHIVSGLSCCLAGLFYVWPYRDATNAELFLTLRGQYFQRQRYDGTY